MRFVLVAGLVAAAAVLAYTQLLDNPPSEPTDVGAPDDTDESDATASSAPTPSDTTDASKPDRDNPTTGPDVPRVLPPDAALEDVRDAIAKGSLGETRIAYEQITRLATTNATFKRALERLIRVESDPFVARAIERALETPWSELDDAAQRALLPKK